MATYHGITKALCLTCGYASEDDTTLEIWNDAGDCPSLTHRADTETTLWVLEDGSITRVSHNNDNSEDDEHTVLTGEEATAAHAKVNAALAARRTANVKGA